MVAPKRKESRAGRADPRTRAPRQGIELEGAQPATVARRRRAIPGQRLGQRPARDAITELLTLEAQLDGLIDDAIASTPAAPTPLELDPEDIAPADDDPGFDPAYDRKARGVLELFYTRWFRTETRNVERIPAQGACLLVVTHAGAAPVDGLLLKTAVKLEHSSARDVRWLVAGGMLAGSPVGSILRRLGAVPASSEGAERLLGRGEVCAVFAEDATSAVLVDLCRCVRTPVVSATMTLDGGSGVLSWLGIPAPARLRIDFADRVET